MMSHRVAAAVVTAATLLCGAPEEPVLLETFDGDAPGPVQRALANHELAEIVPGAGVGGSNAVRVSFVGYDRGSRRLVRRFLIGRSLEEATLNYDVKFAEDFQFVRGGKLHGLGPEKVIAGGNPMTPDGWSARVNFRRDGGIATYLYSQNKSGRYGQGRSSGDGFAFQKDRYHAVSLHIKMNDPDQDNGFAHVYVDGRRVVTHENVQFRGIGGEETRISRFLISTFHGGSSPQWAPRDHQGNFATVHAYFDNFAVYPGRHIRQSPGDGVPATAERVTAAVQD